MTDQKGLMSDERVTLVLRDGGIGVMKVEELSVQGATLVVGKPCPVGTPCCLVWVGKNVNRTASLRCKVKDVVLSQGRFKLFVSFQVTAEEVGRALRGVHGGALH